jgi:2-keto-4-pentenoate hydratase
MPPVTADERISRGMETQLADRAERLGDGEAGLGWKLGFGTSAAMEKLGIEAPLVGYLLESAHLESGATVDLSGWANPKLEPELAAYVAADGTIAAFGPAIELADLDPDASDPEAILAADIFQRHVLLGPPARGASPADVALQVLVNGEEVAATDDVTELTGDPAGLVAHVAATLARSGVELSDGDVIICGSIVPAISVGAGDRVEVRLEPLGELAVAFA